MPCECEAPTPYQRPSGIVICRWCGGRIETPPEKKQRP